MGKNWFPFRRSPEQAASGDRKLAEILKEMAQRLLKQPDGVPSAIGADIALMLAAAAWNFALGDSSLRNRHRQVIRNFESLGIPPCRELRSRDTEKLIEQLVAYKQAHYPNDYRKVVKAMVTPKSMVHVEWVEGKPPEAPSPAGTSSAAAGTESARPVATKLPRMK